MNKEKAIEILKHCGAESHCIDYKHRNCGGCNQRKAQDMAIEALKSEPVRHGKWLEREDDYNRYVYCSECNDEYIEDNELGMASWVKQYFNYCPYCGAKMDKGKEE